MKLNLDLFSNFCETAQKYLILGPHLCTRIWVCAIIGLLNNHRQFSNQVEGNFETHIQ